MAAPSNYAELVVTAGGIYQDIAIFNDEPFEAPLTIEGVDYSAAAFAGDVRSVPDVDVSALKSFTFGTPTFVGGNTVVTVSLAEADVEALSTASEPGGATELFYRIKVTPSGGQKRTFFAGKFTVLGS